MATIAKEAREAHAARREAVGKLFEKGRGEDQRGPGLDGVHQGRPARPASVLNFDNNPYLELQAQPPPAERIAA
jgi:hypothetical protein